MFHTERAWFNKVDILHSLPRSSSSPSCHGSVKTQTNASLAYKIYNRGNIMKTFQYTVTETHTVIYEVQANSEEEARELAGSDVCTVVDDDIIDFEHDMETLEEIF